MAGRTNNRMMPRVQFSIFSSSFYFSSTFILALSEHSAGGDGEEKEVEQTQSKRREQARGKNAWSRNPKVGGKLVSIFIIHYAVVIFLL